MCGQGQVYSTSLHTVGTLFIVVVLLRDRVHIRLSVNIKIEKQTSKITQVSMNYSNVNVRIPSWGWHQHQHRPSCHHRPVLRVCMLDDPQTISRLPVGRQWVVDGQTRSSWASVWQGQSKTKNEY